MSMVASRIRLLAIISFLTILLLVFLKSNYDRKRSEAIAVGTWSVPDSITTHTKMVLHVFANHTYRQEGPDLLHAHTGTWSLSGLSKRKFYFNSIYHYSDQPTDMELKPDDEGRTMTDGFSTNPFTKLSDRPELAISDEERMILGPWASKVEPIHNYVEHAYFYSDHHFVIDTFDTGTWKLVSSQLKLEFEPVDGRPRTSNLRIINSDQLRYVLEGYSLYRQIAPTLSMR
jgi:hypothetical protein